MEGELAAVPWMVQLLYALFAISVIVWIVFFTRMVLYADPIAWSPRRHVPWGIAGAMLALLSLWFNSIQTLNNYISPPEEPPVAPEPGLVTVGQALIFCLVAGLLVLVVAYALHRRDQAGWTDFGMPESAGQFLADIVRGISLCIAMLIPVYAVQMTVIWVLGLPSGHPTIESLMEEPSIEKLLGAIILAGIVAPLFEEFTFRVLLQGWLERLAGPASRSAASFWPIIVSSLLFAITHQGQGAAPAPLFVLALGLGYLYRQTHRLTPCVAAHMFFNAFSLTMAWGSIQANS